MSSAKQQARDLIEQASTTIQAGNPSLALEYLRQSILYNPKDAEAYVLLGISLAQTGKPIDAENALIKATKTDPNNIKGFYNLAVQYYAQEMPKKAYDTVLRALQVMPAHQGSLDLQRRLETELNLEPDQVGKPLSKLPFATNEVRSGYEAEEQESLPIIRAMGPLWNIIGLSIAVLSLVGLLVALGSFRPLYVAGNINKTSLDTLQVQPLFKVLQGVHLATIMGGLAWMIFDLIHRRGNLLWIVPQGICGCVGFTWVILPLYIFFGRNKVQNSTSVT